jgi:hypothetical protein
MLAELDTRQETAEANKKTGKEDFPARMDADTKAWREKMATEKEAI